MASASTVRTAAAVPGVADDAVTANAALRGARAEATGGAAADGGTKSDTPDGGGGRKPHWITKEKTWRERKGQRKSWKKNEHDDGGGGGGGGRGAEEKADRWRAHFGTERTWRTGHKTKSWMTKEKTWKHSHVHL